MSKTFPIHPAAEWFDMMSGDVLDKFVEDVRMNGIHTPIKLRGESLEEAVLIDGRNRLAAINKLGMDWQDHYVLISPEDMPDPVAYVLSLNLHRRHLTESQRGHIAGKLANLKHGSNQHDKQELQICNSTPDVTLADAAKALNVSKRTAASGRKVVADGTEELNAEVAANNIAVSKAAKIAKLPKDKQAEAIKDAKKPARKTKPKPRATSAVNKADQAVSHATPLKALKAINDEMTRAEGLLAGRLAQWVIDQCELKTIHEGCAMWLEWQ